MGKCGMEKRWITKFALTTGVFEAEGEFYPSSGMFVYLLGDHRYYAHGKDHHKTWAQARARAEEMRTKKIKSLEKSIEKMRSLTFEEPR